MALALPYPAALARTLGVVAATALLLTAGLSAANAHPLQSRPVPVAVERLDAPDDEPGDADGPETPVAVTVTGSVRLAAPGATSAGARVAALLPETGEEVAAAVVDANGGYALDVEAEEITLHVVPPAGSNARAVYLGGGTDLATAQRLAVAPDLVVDDIVLPLAAVVAGTVAISGDARYGGTLTVVASGWAPEGLQLAYRWLRDDAVIPGATASSYTLTLDDVDTVVAVEVTGTASGMDPATERSAVVAVGPGTAAAGSVTIAGTARVGARLTASTSGWPTGSTLSYQWTRDGVAISGATSASYTAVAADHARSLRVVVTATRPGYQPSSRTSGAVRVAAGTLAAGTPRITGTVRVGNRLTVDTGSWPAGTRFTYQWRVGGQVVSGQTGRTFTPRPADLGKTVTVRVTGSLAGYTSVTKSATTKSKVAKGVFTSKPTPTISGTVRVGQTLRVRPGTWSPSATLTYQWRVDGRAVPGATRTTYKVRPADRGKRVTVTVTAKRNGYANASKTSAKTAKVTAPFSKTSAPRISGTVRVGATLTARTSAWTPTASFRYQWYADGKAIPGATRSTLKLTTAHYNARITVKVTGSRSTFVTTTKTSAATARVAAPAPTIKRDGTYRVSADVPAGTYVGTGGFGCYWERRSTSGTSLSGIIANDFRGDPGRVIVTISSTDRYFVTDDCGTWTRLMPRGAQSTTISDGMHAVGIHVRPGTYVTNGGQGCYWAILKDARGVLDSIVENEFTWDPARQVVTISTGQFFDTGGCGTWRRTS